MSQLIDFYRGDGTDAEGRTFDEILSWDDDRLEFTHDFIQWLFPTRQPSNFNPDAPLLTGADIEAFRSDAFLRNRMRVAFDRFASFLGLHVASPAGGASLGADPPKVAPDPARFREGVWKRPNHNWLRITRVLTSLRSVGLESLAGSFFACLRDLVEAGYASADSFAHWHNAMGERGERFGGP